MQVLYLIFIPFRSVRKSPKPTRKALDHTDLGKRHVSPKHEPKKSSAAVQSVVAAAAIGHGKKGWSSRSNINAKEVDKYRENNYNFKLVKCNIRVYFSG